MSQNLEGKWYNHEGAVFNFTKIDGAENSYKITAIGTEGKAYFNPQTKIMGYTAQTIVGPYQAELLLFEESGVMVGKANYLGIEINMLFSRMPIPYPKLPYWFSRI